MASDNTTTDLVLRASQPESNNAHSFFSTFPREISSELLLRTSTSESDSTCRFFQIPRELRDQIYDLIFQEKQHPESFRHHGLQAYYFKTRTTLPKIRLVCRQLKLEYDERDKYHLSKNHFRACQISLPNSPDFFGFPLVVSPLAARSTVLYLELKCCQPTHDPQCCLVPTDGSTKGIGGSDWFDYRRHVTYTLAELPLLEKAYIHVSCGARTPLPTGDPLAKIPMMLAQISLFHDVYAPASSSHDDSVQADEQKPCGASSSHPGFLVRRQTKAKWTQANGWDNEAQLDRVRTAEMNFGDTGRGLVYF
jgi:hypothetical protein